MEPEKYAKDYALTLLSRRAYTEKGLYDKLLTRVDEESAAAAVARMIELNLLDDADYARRKASDLMKLKGFAPRRAAMELVRKGIDRELAEEATSGLDDELEPQIARIIQKKYMKYLGDEKGRVKTVNALLRLGYRYGDISLVMRNLDEDESYYENWELE